MESDSSPIVIYIAGSGRSGSTLLERVLGHIPNFVNVGELIDLSRRTAEHNERCGCGQPFGGCPFWRGVGERAFDGWQNGKLARLHRLQARVARQRHAPRLLAMSLAGRGFRADVAEYGACYARLYRAVATEAGAAYVVDASKWPVQALALSRAGIDIRVIHLVRDVRGVAHSLSKPQVARPHALDGTDLMSHNMPAEAAVRWMFTQGQAELLGRCGIPVTRLRYEDFVTHPRRCVSSALTALGLILDPGHLAHIGEERVVLGESHGLSGNPSRFNSGEIALHRDEVWRDQMPRRDRIIVNAITLPLLARYRHPVVIRSSVPIAASPSSAPENSEWPLVTVIMPTRGRPQLVRESIASVITQQYPGEIDCIVVHDQERPDEGLAELATARRRITVVANTHAPGLAGARNTGLELALGDYIATCDDDDTWYPDKLRAQVSRLLREPDLLVVGSGIRLLLPGTKSLEWPGRAERIGYDLLLRNRIKELHSSTLVMRREAFSKAGAYDEQIPHGYAEDYDWVLRAARAGSIGVVTRPLANIRKNATSWYRGAAGSTAPALEYLLAKHPDIAASRRGHARILGQIAFARSSLGERGTAVRYAVKALGRWPASPYPYIALAHSATGVDPRHVLRTARFLRRGMA